MIATVNRKIQIPHLPESRVTAAAVTGSFPQVLEALRKVDIQPLVIPPGGCMPAGIQTHADLRMHHFGGARVMVGEGDWALSKVLSQMGFCVSYTKKALTATYPGDILMNCFSLGGVLVGHKYNLDKTLVEWYSDRGEELAPVRQGYAKCATAIVSSRAAITSDHGIAHVLRGQGIDCLLIASGSILLPGYDTGLIGGACFLLSPCELAFFGDPSYHPDYFEIQRFCMVHNVKMISLLKGSLLDVGSTLILEEIKV